MQKDRLDRVIKGKKKKKKIFGPKSEVNLLPQPEGFEPPINRDKSLSQAMLVLEMGIEPTNRDGLQGIEPIALVIAVIHQSVLLIPTPVTSFVMVHFQVLVDVLRGQEVSDTMTYRPRFQLSGKISYFHI